MSRSANYKSRNILAGMTRIEMLIALYDRAIMHAESMAIEQRSGNQNGIAQHKFKAQKMLHGIFAGINQDGSDLSENLSRLLDFCQHQIAIDQPEPAVHSLCILRDAWEQLREEANQLESTGAIPSIVMTGNSMEVSV